MTDHARMLEGYALCPCGEWVVDAVAARTHGRCVPCFQTHIQPRLDYLEVVGRGMRAQVPRKAKPGKRRRKKRESETRIAKRALARAARDAARQRVSLMVPNLYDAVLADERARRGLEPYPIEIAVRGRDPEADMALAERLLSERGARQ